MVLKEQLSVDMGRYGQSIIDRGDHKSKDTEVRLFREVIQFIRVRGSIILDVGGEVGGTAWEEGCGARIQIVLHSERLWGPANVRSPLNTQSLA